MYRNYSLIAAPLLMTLAACSSDSDYDFEGNKDILDAQIAATSAPQALFNPSTLVLPFPNNLSFQGSEDGTLNLPVAPTDDQSLANPRVALNQADGFSTIAPIFTAISEPLDQSTLTLGTTVRVFKVTTDQGIFVSDVLEEVEDSSISVFSTDNQLVLLPREPLAPMTDYLVVLTNGITDVDGEPLTASLLYGLLKGDQQLTNPVELEGLRLATASQLAEVKAFDGLDSEDDTVRTNTVLSWVFKTQSIREVLQATKNQSDASDNSSLALNSLGINTAAEGINLRGKADIYIGKLDVPYYLTALGDDLDSDKVLGSFWQNSGDNVVGAINASGALDYAPVATGTEVIPVLMSVPNEGEMPGDGWPVTIYQHGITRNRTDMLAIADAMADAGRVVIAIDMPMHGLIDPANPMHADNTDFTERERTFGIDRVDNTLQECDPTETPPPVAGPDNIPDPSGKHFINLQNLANSRDNLRQAVADLFVLRANLSNVQGEGFALNPNNLTFVGHSLGGIVGTTLLSYDASFQRGTLAMPGGGIAQLLANSPAFAPCINQGLESAGIATGSAAYTTFLTVAQTLLDSADPINHATILAEAATPQLHLIEVLGDQVIPNNVMTAPLSGTDPLARLLGLTQITETSVSGGLVKFSEGDHGSIINPTASLAATAEMQGQVTGFANSPNGEITITNTDVIAPLQ